MKKIRAITLLICLSFLLSGCGYTTKAYNLPASIKTVFIETFKNNTDEPNLENELKTKLVAAFQDEGHLTVVVNEQADAYLKGQIIGYSRQAMRYTADESVQEYRLNITVAFEFIEKDQQKPLVKANSFTGNASYYLSGSNAKSESTAKAEALDNLSRLLLNKIITLW